MEIDKQIMDAVNSVTRKYFLDRNNADEAAANTYLYLLNYKKPIRSLLYFALSIARYQCIIVANYKKREKKDCSKIDIAYDADPLDKMILEERDTIIAAAIDQLPEIWYDTAVLFYLEQLSHKQVAEKLNVKVGTVKSRLFTIRKLLKEQLNDM